MALTIPPKDTQRLTFPEFMPGVEKGDWVELRTAWTYGLRRQVAKRAIEIAGVHDIAGTDADPWAYRLALLEGVIVAWSDVVPPSVEAFESSPPEVMDWIVQEFYRLAEGRSKEEAANLDNGSSPGPVQDEADSHPSLATSSR